MHARSTFALAVLVVPIGLAACGDEGAREAEIFLDRAGHLSIEAPLSERHDAVAALEALPLETPEVVEVRDACVRGHSAMIEAEEAQLEATRALAQATGGDPNAAIRPEDARRIEATIERSNAAVGEARTGLRACDEGITALRTRFASRR